MVFSLFGKSKAPSDATLSIDDRAQQTQLRTPSPTASVSAGTIPPQSPEITPAELTRGVKRSRSLSPKPTAPSNTAAIDVLRDAGSSAPTSPAELLSRIKKVPAKTLHTYVISHLPHAPLEISEALMAFFAQLQPPPRLHCVRCHKDYVEVENTDRSCLVPHDDESAEVEYVGNAKNKGNLVGSTYQTLWGCCNKVVEGDGDQGPPDGWCFEGLHTTDVKRARFRADSTVFDDKLVSCKRMRCFGAGSSIAGSERGRSQRAAARKSLREASDEEEDYDERELQREAQALADNESDGGDSASVSSKKKSAKHRKRKSDVMDVEAEGSGEAQGKANPLATLSTTKSKSKTKAESMKPKSAAKSKQDKMTESAPAEASAASHGDVEMTAPEDEPKQKPKKPRKPRKSAADGGKYVPPKDEEESSDFDEEDDKPKRKKPKRKSIVSAAAVPS